MIKPYHIQMSTLPFPGKISADAHAPEDVTGKRKHAMQSNNNYTGYYFAYYHLSMTLWITHTANAACSLYVT